MIRARVVALGGGTGLSSLLVGLKGRDLDISAIVSVSDDGGSSGRLRRELGMLPPGDVRNVLVSLADDDSLMGRLFQHRFADGDLSGHPFGNLILAALTEVTGSFDEAVRECSRVLKVNGRVIPGTLQHVRLWAERADGSESCGETLIASGVGACRRIWLDPEPSAHPDAVAAIADADLVLLGPGSLFTSVLPHLAVGEIVEAIRVAPGLRGYVCNVMTQPGETDGMDATAHLDCVLEMCPGGVDVVVVHAGGLDPAAVAHYRVQGQEPVVADASALESRGVRVVAADIAEDEKVVRHSPERLGDVVVRLAREGVERRAMRGAVDPAKH
ncbi:MAG: uridine diphosphate-N-acetylglucosamine-binding protein YvcK [Thermoleophilia bacterium]|nr:uridine diphosphate-N-acetylglucosamine-binding protein YvcK [Thermoleophilia bacterium]